MAALKLHAQPYAYGGRGFYFSDFDEYEEKEEKSPHEEWMIEFIDGDGSEAALFQAMGVNQGNLDTYFDVLDEGWGDEEMVALVYLTQDLGYKIDEALEKVEDVSIVEGTAEDYAYEYLEAVGYPTSNDWYFDHERFGRDVDIEGSMRPDPDDFDEGEDDPDYIAQEERYDRMSHKDLGEHVVDEVYGGIGEMSPEIVQRYFDHAAWVRDVTMNGDWNETTVDGTDYTITNASSL